MQDQDMPERGKIKAYRAKIALAYFLIYIVWGSTYYFISVAVAEIPPFLLGALRFTIAGLLLLLLCGLKKETVFDTELLLKSAVSGTVLLFIDMAVIMLAEQYVSSSFVAAIAASTAIWIMVLDVPAWRNNFRSLRMILGIVVGFIGVLLLFGEKLGATGFNSSAVYGIALLIFGCISWSLGTLFTKYYPYKNNDSGSLAGASWQMVIAGISFWIVSLFRSEFTLTRIHMISGSAWLALVYLIVFGSLLAYTAYIWLLKVRPAAEVATHAYVNPFVAVFIGSMFGGEQVSVLQLMGLIVIVLGVLLIGSKKRKPL